ncbi:MAG: T9SS type A sorting domain-containing protein [Cytophagales bacterium]
MKHIFVLFISTLCYNFAFAQFDPQIGYGKNGAIYKDSSIIKSWATSCSLNVGKRDISLPSSPLVNSGNEISALGKAGTDGVVSLGDGGFAILQFAKPVTNGEGPDFAVYENGFTFQTLGNAFLELAFVEVSSDGTNYYRFPAISHTDTTTQTGSFQVLDARKLNNLAGKYIFAYGTPFDLEELKTVVGLDVDRITHVKIIDVIGSIDNQYASRDSRGAKVNDPWPTNFPSAGFDLDAVAVLNELNATPINQFVTENINIYPNPISNGEILTIQSSELISDLQMVDLLGNNVALRINEEHLLIDNTNAGVYFLSFNLSNSTHYQKIMVR